MKIQMIINPSSGDQSSGQRLDELYETLSKRHEVNRFYTEKKDDCTLQTLRSIEELVDLIIVSGGDGTVHETVSAFGTKASKVPVLIIANGTVNDFSRYLHLPTENEKILEMVENMSTIEVDIGKVNNRYFVNVAAFGLLSEIGHKVDIEAKARLGRLAYYFEGVKTFPELMNKPITLNIITRDSSLVESVYLCIVSNSSSIGGFENLAPEASVTDGKLDVLVIKKSSFFEMASTMLKSLRGEHIDNENVLYFQTDYLEISAPDQHVELDVDGELGGQLPATISVSKNKMRVVIPTT